MTYRRSSLFYSHLEISQEGFQMHNAQVLQYLKKHGQLLDSEIAVGTGIPLPEVRISLTDLSALKEISNCSVTQFKDGKPVEGLLCRISGYVPPASPGRKSGANH
jgi:hypothetical protein